MSPESLALLWILPAIAATGASWLLQVLIFCAMTLVLDVKRSLQQLEGPFVN